MTTPAESDKTSDANDETRTVGRGALLLTVTKFWFLATSYVIVFGLASIFGGDDVGVANYGKYRTVTTLIAIVNAFIVVGTQQAVSRFVGREPEHGDGVRRAAFRQQAFLGGGLYAILFFAAPLLATKVYDSPELVTPLRYAGLITLFYAFYSVHMGYLNGRKLFVRQAVVDFSYATLKCLLILGVGAYLAGKLGAVTAPVAGFATAAGAAFAIAFALAGRARGPGETSVSALFKFQLLTMAFAGLSSFVLQFDLHVLKILGPGGERGEYLAGLYGAAQQFSQIPFQAVFAITFVLFPLVSGVAERDPERLRAYVGETARYGVIIATGVIALFVACPERTINVLFKARYAEGAGALRLLATGYLAYAPFYVFCCILNAAGRPRTSLALIAMVAVVQVGLGAALVGPLEMEGVALGTLGAMVLGLVVAHFRLRALYGQGIVVGTYLKTLGTGVVVGLVAHLLLARTRWGGGEGIFAAMGASPEALVSRLTTVIGFALLGVVYLVLLYAVGVLNQEDRRRFLRVVRRG